uniref:Uncharacterized protein n=1 Tax=viral metagenome TaxID=1070528 RepID=A0A6H1ZBD6_9ZZZZ
MNHNNRKWYTVFVGSGYSRPTWTKIAEIKSEGLVNLIMSRLVEIYLNQPVEVYPGKLAIPPEEVTL